MGDDLVNLARGLGQIEGRVSVVEERCSDLETAVSTKSAPAAKAPERVVFGMLTHAEVLLVVAVALLSFAVVAGILVAFGHGPQVVDTVKGIQGD